MLNIAHRGASGHAPEHTWPAYDLALSLGAGYLELDVHMTRDGHLVVLHDATVDRTAWGSSGWVADLSLAEIRACDVGSWFNAAFPEKARPDYAGLGVPTLDDVFLGYGPGVRYYVELKDPELYPGIEEELLRLLRAHDMRDRAASDRGVLIQSFLPQSLLRIHACDPGLPLVRLYPEDAPVTETLGDTAGYAVGIGPCHTDVCGGLVEAAHELSLEVHPYTVDSRSEMLRLAALGVDGIFTNYPERLLDVLDLASVERELAGDADVVDGVAVGAAPGSLVGRVP